MIALEGERFAALGAPVFARGHLRRYAELLGVPRASAGRVSRSPVQRGDTGLIRARDLEMLPCAPRRRGRCAAVARSHSLLAVGSRRRGRAGLARCRARRDAGAADARRRSQSRRPRRDRGCGARRRAVRRRPRAPAAMAPPMTARTRPRLPAARRRAAGTFSCDCVRAPTAGSRSTTD